MLSRSLTIIVYILFGMGHAVAGDVCEDAQLRYKEMKNTLPSDEGFTIVTLYKYNFCPKRVTIKKDSTVRFVNVDKRTSHSVWLKEDDKEESDRFFPEEFWDIKFEFTGNFPYLCGPHWEQKDMVGSVTVE